MPSYPGLVLAMLLTTLGEMLISPAMPSFISDHADRSAPFYLGLSGGIGAVGRVLGPYMMGSLYDREALRRQAGWLAEWHCWRWDSSRSMPSSTVLAVHWNKMGYNGL